MFRPRQLCKQMHEREDGKSPFTKKIIEGISKLLEWPHDQVDFQAALSKVRSVKISLEGPCMYRLTTAHIYYLS